MNKWKKESTSRFMGDELNPGNFTVANIWFIDPEFEDFATDDSFLLTKPNIQEWYNLQKIKKLY